MQKIWKAKSMSFQISSAQMINASLFMSWWWNDELLKRSSNSKIAIFQSMPSNQIAKVSHVDMNSFYKNW